MDRFGMWVVQALLALFLAILFLQSGLDKVIDRKGNREYIKGVFAKSPLARVSGFLLIVITLIELAAGFLSGAGFLGVVLLRQEGMALGGAILSALAICCLFFGQRIAKDYAGAAGLVPYFAVSIAAIAALSAR
jgi:hypothetical protein